VVEPSDLHGGFWLLRNFICGGFWLLWLIYGGCGGGEWEGIVMTVGYFLWEIMIKKNKKYNI
jgi:hypothetical protein